MLALVQCSGRKCQFLEPNGSINDIEFLLIPRYLLGLTGGPYASREVRRRHSVTLCERMPMAVQCECKCKSKAISGDSTYCRSGASSKRRAVRRRFHVRWTGSTADGRFRSTKQV